MSFPNTQSISDFSFNLAFNMNQLILLLFQGYVLCYFIGTITMYAASISEIIYSLYWFEMPQKERYIVGFVIRRAQKPVALRGLGLFACSLETYWKVIFLIIPIFYWILFITRFRLIINIAFLFQLLRSVFCHYMIFRRL